MSKYVVLAGCVLTCVGTVVAAIYSDVNASLVFVADAGYLVFAPLSFYLRRASESLFSYGVLSLGVFAAVSLVVLGWQNVSDCLVLFALIGAGMGYWAKVPESHRLEKCVLLVTRHVPPDVGGTETFISQFWKVAHEKRMQVRVVTFEPLAGRAESPPGVEITYLSWPWLSRLLWDNKNADNPVASAVLFGLSVALLVMLAVRETIRCRPSLIYGVGGVIACFAAGVAGRLAGIPVAVHFHRLYQWSTKPPLTRLAAKALFWLPDSIIGNSRTIETDAAALGFAGKAHGILNWVDESRFKSDDTTGFRSKFGIREDATVLTYVGLLDPIKQTDIVLAGLRELIRAESQSEIRSAAQIVFVGHGVLETEVQELAESPELDVRFLGLRNAEELVQILNCSDAMLWGSVDVDYPGLVVMEAMLCGCHIVTSTRPMNGLYAANSAVDASSFGAPKYAQTFPADSTGVTEAIKYVVKNADMLRRRRSETALFAKREFGIANAERLLNTLLATMRDGEREQYEHEQSDNLETRNAD